MGGSLNAKSINKCTKPWKIAQNAGMVNKIAPFTVQSTLIAQPMLLWFGGKIGITSRSIAVSLVWEGTFMRPASICAYRRACNNDCSLGGQFWPQIWNQQPQLPWFVCVYCPFSGLWGHGGLQMALEVTSDLRFELSNLNYICYHASLACKGFLEIIQTTTTGQLSSIDERCTLVKRSSL